MILHSRNFDLLGTGADVGNWAMQTVEICELSDEVCFIAIEFKQRTSGLLGGWLNLKKQKTKKSSPAY